MTPILGITASQITGHLWAPSNSYDSIATTTVGAGGVSSISFTSIPSTYTHLQIRCLARQTGSITSAGLNVRMNNDSGGNYAWHDLYGTGSSVGVGSGNTTSVQYLINDIPGASQTASMFGVAVLDILDYANTSKYKTSRAASGADYNGSGAVHLASGVWQSLTAINRIDIFPNTGFAQYSSFALYGIKG